MLELDIQLKLEVFKMDEDVNKEYMTYNGLNRPAMIKGIPLMLGLVVCFIAAFGGFIAIYLCGFKGFIFPISCILFLFFVRVLCENDPNALTVHRLSLAGMWLKIKHGDSVIGFSSFDDNEGL